MQPRCVYLVAALVVTSACAKEQTKREEAPLEVPVVELTPRDLPVYAEFVGTVDGVENAEIRARVPGYLEQVHYQEGTPVKTGQLLFTIDPVLSQAAANQAKGELEIAAASVAKAEVDVTRLRPLAASNAVSKQELDHAVAEQQTAKAQLEAARGRLQTAQANLGYTKIYSPIDGIAGVKRVSIGTLVGQGEPTLLTTISKLDPVKVRFPIAEQLYLKLGPAMTRILSERARPPTDGQLELILADGAAYPHRGYVQLIDRAIQVTTGTILIEARFPNPELLLRPGQFAKVRGRIDLVKDALAVPQRAVMERQSMHQVFVVAEGNKAELRTVTVGQRVGQLWVLAGGVKPHERVMLEGLQKIRPGQVVDPRPVPPQEPAPAAEPSAAPVR